jgi:hypothetical protein
MGVFLQLLTHKLCVSGHVLIWTFFFFLYVIEPYPRFALHPVHALGNVAPAGKTFRELYVTKKEGKFPVQD